jgi:ABC-type nitrate/sulfonate/bicarbonate transport system substrate-binding protein
MASSTPPATLRAGGVPEHFNFIWHRDEFHRGLAAEGLTSTWVDFPGGTGAIVEALERNEIDLAPVLTEGAVAAIAGGAAVRVISTWVTTPLNWGVHVPARHPARSIEDLRGATFAISRQGSGSHLMAAVIAQQRGWREPRYERVGDLEGARKALEARSADAFLWERYTTKHLVDSGEWRRVGIVPTPWPSFVMIASDRAIAAQRQRITALLRCLHAAFAAVTDNEARAFIAERYRLLPEDVAEWWSQTGWRCDWLAPAAALEPAIEALLQAGILDTKLRAAALCWAEPE